MLVEVEVQSLGLDRNTNNPVLILKEEGGTRVLPIWIGPGEASAIAVQLANMKFPRPLTHDLMASLVGDLGGTLDEVKITRVVQDTFFAELVIRTNGHTVSVDARPSDSIALALRAGARILAEETLLENVRLEVAPDPSAEGSVDPELSQDPAPPQPRLEADALKEYLKNLDPEDFGRFTP